MPQYYDAKNRIVTTEGQLARGGEGTIFTVQGNKHQAAKIWTSPDHNRVEKLYATVRNTPPGNPRIASAPYTWPQEILRDPNDRTVGYLMPKLDTKAFTGVVAYYNRSLRAKTEAQYKIRIDQRLLVTAARNLAKAVGTIHDAGHVIGDVNENNIMMNDHGDIVIVDIDSIQIHDRQSGKTYRCQVGREDYTPPRLQGSNFRQEIRTKDDDCFGLAVIIFKLLMGGMHPFSSVVEPDDQGAIAELGQKIKQQLFPYNEDSTVPDKYKVAAPEYKLAWANARDETKTLFREAFDPFYIKNNPRPDAKRWAQALERQLEMEQQKGRTVSQVTMGTNQGAGAPRVPIVQGQKEKNQAQVQYAINQLLDDLKELTLRYSEQGIQDNVWDFNDLRKIKAGSVAKIHSLPDMRRSSDIPAFLYILISITEKLDPNWTRQWNLEPGQIREVIAVRNKIHELQKFADAKYATGALTIIHDLHNGIKAAPRTWPKEAVAIGGQYPPAQNQGPPGPASSQQASTGPDWDEWIAKIVGFIREYPLTLPLISVGILIIWFAPRLSEMEDKGTWTLVTIFGAPFSAFLYKRLNLAKFIRQTPGLAKRTWNASSQTSDPAVKTATRSAIVVAGLILIATPLTIGIVLSTSPGNHSSEDQNQQVQTSAENSVATATASSDMESSTPAEPTSAPAEDVASETAPTVQAMPTYLPVIVASTEGAAVLNPTSVPPSAPTGITAPPLDLQVHTYRQQDFSIMYPTDWAPKDDLMGFTAPDGQGRLEIRVSYFDPAWSIQEFIDHIKVDEDVTPGMGLRWKEYIEERTRMGNIGGIEFMEIDFAGQIESGRCLHTGTTRWLPSRYRPDFTARGYSISISVCEEDLEEYEETMKQVLNSFVESNHDFDILRELQRRAAEATTEELAGPGHGTIAQYDPGHYQARQHRSRVRAIESCASGHNATADPSKRKQASCG